MFAGEEEEMLREVLGSFNQHDLDAIMSRFPDDCVFATTDGVRVDVRGCDLSTFGDDGKIIRKDSFWKIREA